MPYIACSTSKGPSADACNGGDGVHCGKETAHTLGTPKNLEFSNIIVICEIQNLRTYFL